MVIPSVISLNYILAHLCAFPRTPKGTVKRGDISTSPMTNLGKGRTCQKELFIAQAARGPARVREQVQRCDPAEVRLG